MDFDSGRRVMLWSFKHFEDNYAVQGHFFEYSEQMNWLNWSGQISGVNVFSAVSHFIYFNRGMFCPANFWFGVNCFMSSICSDITVFRSHSCHYWTKVVISLSLWRVGLRIWIIQKKWFVLCFTKFSLATVNFPHCIILGAIWLVSIVIKSTNPIFCACQLFYFKIKR